MGKRGGFWKLETESCIRNKVSARKWIVPKMRVENSMETYFGNLEIEHISKTVETTKLFSQCLHYRNWNQNAQTNTIDTSVETKWSACD